MRSCLLDVERSDPGALDGKVNQWNHASQQFSAKAEVAWLAVDSLDSTWQGKSADAFVLHMKELTDHRFHSASQFFNHAAGSLQSAGRAIREAQDAVRSVGGDALAQLNKLPPDAQVADVRNAVGKHTELARSHIRKRDEILNLKKDELNRLTQELPEIFEMKSAGEQDFVPAQSRKVIWAANPAEQPSDITGSGAPWQEEHRRFPTPDTKDVYERPAPSGPDARLEGQIHPPNDNPNEPSSNGVQPGGSQSGDNQSGQNGSSGESGGSGNGSDSSGSDSSSDSSGSNESGGSEGSSGSGNVANTAVGAAAPAEVDGWVRQAIDIMQQKGIPVSEADIEAIKSIIMKESGGDPGIVNTWDSNAQKGTPSIGLMQCIQPTFDTHALPGHGDIRNPVDNIIAGVNYTIDRYGSLGEHPGLASMASGGEYKPY